MYILHQLEVQYLMRVSTSRINVGSFMADLIIETDTWNKWKGQIPAIYNKAQS